MRDYLTSSDHAFDHASAKAAPEELLAVNAESVGLVVENSAGEVGFSHASFGEYLAATHIQEWPWMS